MEAIGRKFYYLKDHIGSTRAVVYESGVVKGRYHYYPFVLEIHGFILNSGVGTKNLFTGEKLDWETRWYQLGSRSFISVLGHLLSSDNFADKYPSWSPYHYVLNNPVRFTDITGDTVDVDPQLLEPVVYTEGEKKGQTKSLADMTPAERQRYFFQQWWVENQEMVNELFGIGGKYETTNIGFQLGTKPLSFGQKIFNFFAPPALREPQFGQTAWGKQGTEEAELSTSPKDIIPDFGIEELQMNVYFNPEMARDRYFTPPHEWKHVQIIFDSVKRGVAVPAGIKQHQMINRFQVPALK